jgi:hypothetical protein
MYGILAGTGFWNRAGLNYLPLSQDTFLTMDSILVHSGYYDVLDGDWINLKLANDYFGTGDTLNGFERVKRLKFLVFKRPSDTERGPFYNMLLNIAKQLTIHGKTKEAMGIIEKFSSTKNKLQGYSTLAAFTRINGHKSESAIFQDSALANRKRVKFFRMNRGDLGFDYRTGLVNMFALQDNGSGKRQALENISSMEFEAKLSGVLAMVRTLSMMGHYYEARSSIPGLANPEDRLRCINTILYEEVMKQSKEGDPVWSNFDNDLTAWLNYTEFIYDLFEY